MANIRVQNRSQSKGGGNCHNCDTSHPPKHCPAYGKTCYNCNKKDTSSLFVGVTTVASLVPDGRKVRAKVIPGRTNMKFHHVIKLMTVTGTHVNRILSRLYTIKVFMEISLNICFDEIDGQNCSNVSRSNFVQGTGSKRLSHDKL